MAADPDRLAAYEALVKIDKNRAYSNIELNSVLRRKTDSGDAVKNPGFVRELTYGVTENRILLDHYIGSLVNNGIDSVKRELKVLLRMGIYQILYMDSVPDHSAVDETVKIAKTLFRGKEGFVNGVLRSFLRGKADNPHNIEDPEERLHVLYSCDKGIVHMLISQYGEESAEDILKVSLETPPLYIRVNTLKTDVSGLSEKLRKLGFAVNDNIEYANHIPEGVLQVSGRELIESEPFVSGEFFVQDASSADAVAAFEPEPGDIVIDVCAAPGGKTFTAAIMMQDRGEIRAMDLHDNKLKALRKQAYRLGITIIDTEQHDAKEICEKYKGTADKVICDVPCSGLGVLRRKPEIKDRPLKNEGRDIAEIQYRILSASSAYVRNGGKLMYSTCTVNKTENRKVAERFISDHPDFSMSRSLQTLPESGGPDGFYYCIFVKDKK